TAEFIRPTTSFRWAITISSARSATINSASNTWDTRWTTALEFLPLLSARVTATWASSPGLTHILDSLRAARLLTQASWVWSVLGSTQWWEKQQPSIRPAAGCQFQVRELATRD